MYSDLHHSTNAFLIPQSVVLSTCCGQGPYAGTLQGQHSQCSGQVLALRLGE